MLQIGDYPLTEEGKPSYINKVETPETDLSPENKELLAAASSAQAALESLLNRISSLKQDTQKSITLVVYFDEAHELTKKGFGPSEKKSYYDVLCSCMFHFFKKEQAFFIFLSTNSDLAKIAPSKAQANSSRMINDNAALHAPITKTPFDFTREELSSVPFMAKFGRPL